MKRILGYSEIKNRENILLFFKVYLSIQNSRLKQLKFKTIKVPARKFI